MYRSLLVPLDGSQFGEQALPLALTIARRAGATLRLVHVHPPLAGAYAEGHLFMDPTLDRQVAEQQRAYLARLAGRLASHGSVTVSSDVLQGEIVTTLRDLASGTGTDLVV